MGKRDFLYLKNTRADALKLEGEIQEAKNQVKTSERQVEWLTKKLYDVRKKNYSEEIATAKSAKRQVINETRKLDFDNSEQKSYLKDKIYNLKHRTIKFHILASFASIVTIVSLILVLFITGTEEDQENIQRAWTPDTLGDWGGFFIVCITIFLVNEAIRDTMIEACKENLKKIKEKENEPLRKLKNQITEYDEKIRDLEHAQKNKQTWKMNLVKEKKKLEQHIILIAEKNSQLLELLKSIEHLIP